MQVDKDMLGALMDTTHRHEEKSMNDNEMRIDITLNDRIVVRNNSRDRVSIFDTTTGNSIDNIDIDQLKQALRKITTK